jgi:hypothetical protein
MKSFKQFINESSFIHHPSHGKIGWVGTETSPSGKLTWTAHTTHKKWGKVGVSKGLKNREDAEKVVHQTHHNFNMFGEENNLKENSGYVTALEKGLKKLDNHSYDSINNLMMDISKKNNTTGKDLHDDFVAKHGKTPDDWIKEHIEESAAWQRKAGKNPEGGLNRKGIASYRRENPGSKLSMAVTTPPSKLKPGSKAANRRKSFCARMGGMEGPMKKPNGEPTRKALALRKWNC